MHALKPVLYARERHLRRAEYEQLVELGAFRDERVELIYGRLVEMSAHGRLHSYTLMQLGEMLPRAVGLRARVRTQLPFTAIDESLPEPDVAIVEPGEYLDSHPSRAHLLIEVADSSPAYDRLTKGPLYAASGVPEYWIVNLVDMLIEVYTDPSDDSYLKQARQYRGDQLHLPSFDDVAINVSDILPPDTR